jgi:RNAse (barnase) inhibitor barstar
MMTRLIGGLLEAGWGCVHFSDCSSLPELSDSRFSTFKIFEVDFSGKFSKDDFILSIAKAMGFPGYFGGNWDALDECLRDMEWLPASGYVLIVRNSEDLWRRSPRLAAGLLESWTFSAEEWSREGVPFHLVFAW